jgi:hypothetical protein
MTVASHAAQIPSDLANQASQGRLTVSLRNDSLALVHEGTVAAEFDVLVKTVAGDRSESKTLKFKFDTRRTTKKVPGDIIDLTFTLDDLKSYSVAKLNSVMVDYAYFDSGAMCQNGKIALNASCTIPANAAFVGSNLADMVCSMDTTLDATHRAAAISILNAKLQAAVRNQPPLCPENEVRALALVGDGTRLGPALRQALPRCPGVIGSVISAPVVWHSWPCPECMEACTGSTTQSAIDSNLMPRDVGAFSRCISACSASCSPATITQVRSLSDSDRRFNWPSPDTSALRPITNLLGLSLHEPATHVLASFAATPANFHPRCNEPGVQCFDLTWTGTGRGPRAVKIRAAIKDEKIRLLAFELGYGDQSNPQYWHTFLEQQFGPPTARYYAVDAPAQNTVFGHSDNPRNYVLGRWKAEGGSVDANLLDFAPGSGEARDTELIFLAQ